MQTDDKASPVERLAKRNHGDIEMTEDAQTSDGADVSPSASNTQLGYTIEVESGGCQHCGHGKEWTIVGPDGYGIGTSWQDEETAQNIVDLMNMAYDAGKK